MIFFNKPKLYKNYIEDWYSYEQIIVCKNGVFKRVRVNSICYVTKKTSFEKLGIDESKIVYDKELAEEIYLEEKPYMKRKIPESIVKKLLIFYQLFAEKNLEVKLNIWYDKVKEEFFLDCPFQENHTVTVTEYEFDHPEIKWTEKLKEIFPQKYLLKQRKKCGEIEKILETHSHHNMSLSFSSQDDSIDYFHSVGYHLIGVYTSVLQYPVLHLRYFVSPYSKGRILTAATKKEDEVLFEEKDIIEANDFSDFECDFNEFVKHVHIKESDLF